MLIFFRVLQGLVAGPMIPLSQTLLLSSYPTREGRHALAMWAMTALVAPVAGPLLGGWITDNISWPWIFYINMPVGLLAAGVDLVDLPQARDGPRQAADRRRRPRAAVVWSSARCRSCSTRARSSTGSTPAQIVALAVVAVVGFAFFLAWELTEKHPIVDLRLFARRNFLIGTLALSIALRPVLRQRRAAAAVAAAVHGLHRHVGRPGDWRRSASSRSCCRRWSARTSPRSTRAGCATIAFVGFALVLWMRSHFNTQADFDDDPDPDDAAGRGDGVLLHSAAGDHSCRA